LPNRAVLVLVLGFTLAVLVFNAVASASTSIEAVCIVKRVVDGDTIVVKVEWVAEKFNKVIHAGSQYRVRFADINAPELDTEEGVAAKNALASVVKPGMTVYLDVDDVDVFDKYGRIVAVVLIKYNETHMLNLNKWMLDTGHAVVWDFPNEFNPETWTLYVEVESTTGYQVVLPTSSSVGAGTGSSGLWIAAVLAAVLVAATAIYAVLRKK